MLSKYTNEVILTYDGDEAGQNATRRAVPMLEETGLQAPGAADAGRRRTRTNS